MSRHCGVKQCETFDLRVFCFIQMCSLFLVSSTNFISSTNNIDDVRHAVFIAMSKRKDKKALCVSSECPNCNVGAVTDIVDSSIFINVKFKLILQYVSINILAFCSREDYL